MSVKESFAQMMGCVEKAVFEIASFEVKQAQEKEAPKASAGAGVPGGGNGMAGTGEFNDKVVGDALNQAGIDKSALGVEGDKGFQEYGNLKRYRYQVMFNPEDINITGYGGEEVATQDFVPKPPGMGADNQNPPGPPPEPGKGNRPRPKPTSRMATQTTRIDFNVRIVIDRTDPQDAFYGDKFTLSQTSLAREALKQDKEHSVQRDVEALTAAVRDRKKRLCRFVWGDMVYEGLLNSVSADYVMFNTKGEPCRAVVTIGMVLYDQHDIPAAKTIWDKEYSKDFGTSNAAKERSKAITVHMGE